MESCCILGLPWGHFLSPSRRELLPAGGRVLPLGHGRLRLDRGRRRMEPLVSDPHPALHGQDHQTPAWWTQILGGLKHSKPASSSTGEQWGAGRLTKHFKHLLRNKKERESIFSQKRPDLSREASPSSCQPRCGAGKPPKATTYVPQCKTLHFSLGPLVLAVSTAAGGEAEGPLQPIAHGLETTRCMTFGFDTESGQIKLFSGAPALPEPILSYRPGNISNSLTLLSPSHSLTHDTLKSINWYMGRLSYGILGIVWAGLKAKPIFPESLRCELCHRNWMLVVFIQLLPAWETKPSWSVASRFKPAYPVHAQNCSHLYETIINTLTDWKTLTDWFIWIKLILARNYSTQIVRNRILGRCIHAGGLASLQSNSDLVQLQQFYFCY